MAITWTTAAWAQSTAYLLGARVVNGGNIYRATVAGTSFVVGTGPSGTDEAITDGTVTWRYLGANEGAVTDIAPDLSTVTHVMQVAILDIVEEILDPVIWGTRLAAGLKFLAAHFAAFFLRGSGSGVGPVSSESEGPLSISYATASTTAALSGLDSTPHGMSYSFLLSTLPQARLGIVV